jgi:hypothetical protein
MDKKKILSQLIAEQERKYDLLVSETNNIVQSVNESPSAAESHSDTSRAQNSWLADGNNAKAVDLHNQILVARNYTFNNLNGKVNIGSLVNMEVNKNSEWYFILPFFGGAKLQTGLDKVVVLNAQSPIAQKIIGQKKGYEFAFTNRNYAIADVK